MKQGKRNAVSKKNSLSKNCKISLLVILSSFPFTRSFIIDRWIYNFSKQKGKIVVQKNCPSGANHVGERCRQKEGFKAEGTWSKSRIRVQDKGERRLSRGEGEVLEFSACGVVSPGCKTTCKTCARDAFCQLRFWPYLHGKSIEESVKNTTNRATNSNYDTRLRVNYVQTKRIRMNYPRLEDMP